MCDLCHGISQHLPGCPNDSVRCPACSDDDCELCGGGGEVDERTARFWQEAQRELEVERE